MDTKRKTKPLSERLWAKVKRAGPNECWEWTGWRHPFGHGQIGRGRRQDGTAYTHVVAWEVANGRRVPDGLIVRHTCDNPACCNPGHLLLGTKADNMLDMVARRRHQYGSKSPNAKLTEDEVREIKRLIRAGEADNVIGDKYGVSRGTVYCIRHGKSWTHVA